MRMMPYCSLTDTAEPGTAANAGASAGRRSPWARRLSSALLGLLLLAGLATFGWSIARPGAEPPVLTTLFVRDDGWWASQAEIAERQPFLFAEHLYIAKRRYWPDTVTLKGMRFAGRLPRLVREVEEITIPSIDTWSATSEDLHGLQGWPHYHHAWRYFPLRGYAGVVDLGSAAVVLTASRPGTYLFRDPTIWGTIRLGRRGPVRRWRETFDMHYVACVGFRYNRCVKMIDKVFSGHGV